MINKLYDEKFYEKQIDGSYRSAVIYAQHLSTIFVPMSVADLGCGRGAWLKAFGQIGSRKLVGFDGRWNSQNQMIDQNITYIPTDLNEPLNYSKDPFDLAISLEVAEHLDNMSSAIFIQNLTSLSDVVLFGAAYKNQGGVDHINEQTHTYWAKLFIQNGFFPYDIFRPLVWGNVDVKFWYQQNTFLYVKRSSKINQVLWEVGYKPISNIEFMNCIHPRLLEFWVQTNTPLGIFKRIIKRVLPRKLHAIAAKLKNALNLGLTN